LIGIGCPDTALKPREHSMQRIPEAFSLWEITGEGTWRLEDARECLMELRDAGMRMSVHLPFSDVNLAGVNPRILEVCLQEIESAVAVSSELDISPCTLHPGFIGPLTRLDRELAYRTARDSIRKIDAMAREYSVVIGVENLPGGSWMIFNTPEEMENLLEGTDLGFTFDVGHAHTSGNIMEFLDLRDRIVNVHIHDNMGEYDQHLVLGEGTLPLEDVVRKLAPHYSGNWIIESNTIEEGITSRRVLEDIIV